MTSRPVRTCVGCRKRAAKTDLLRVVAQVQATGLVLVPDPCARQPGRGAYLHPSSVCLEQALRRRAFGRALKVVGGLDETLVRRHGEDMWNSEGARP